MRRKSECILPEVKKKVYSRRRERRGIHLQCSLEKACETLMTMVRRLDAGGCDVGVDGW